MNWVDYLIIGVIAASAFLSLIRGFVKEALSLIVWFSAFFIASQYYIPLASYFTTMPDLIVRNGIAITVLFVCTLAVGGIVNFALLQIIQKAGLSGPDRLLGVVFGLVRGILIVSVVLFLLDSFSPLPTTPEWKDAVLIPHFGLVIEWFFGYLQQNSGFLPKS